MNPKIKTLAEIRETAKELRSDGKTISTCNGAFDIIHTGHISFLKAAKEQADILIVGLNSDSSIKEYKDPKRPIIPENQRAEVLAAIRYVDYVVIFPEPDPLNFLEAIRPDVHVNGAEYGRDCIERKVLDKYGGKLHMVEKSEDTSTTDIIKKILRLYCECEK